MAPTPDIEAQSNSTSDSSHNGDDLSFEKTYQATVLPASTRDFDPEPHKQLFRTFANPGPLGLCAFALTTFILSLINVRARSVSTPNVMIGIALAYGGLAQFCAGMWEFAVGNTFGALAFSSFGPFWFSFGVIFIPWFNIAGAYTDPSEFTAALGLYLTCWGLMAGFLCVATIRSSVAFFGMFFLLTVTFFLLAIGYYKGEDVALIKAGGYLGLITALLAWYNGMAGLWNTGNSYITLPLGQFPWAVKGRPHIGRPPRK